MFLLLAARMQVWMIRAVQSAWPFQSQVKICCWQPQSPCYLPESGGAEWTTVNNTHIFSLWSLPVLLPGLVHETQAQGNGSYVAVQDGGRGDSLFGVIYSCPHLSYNRRYVCKPHGERVITLSHNNFSHSPPGSALVFSIFSWVFSFFG